MAMRMVRAESQVLRFCLLLQAVGVKASISIIESSVSCIRRIKESPDAVANLLGCGMNNPTSLILLALLGAFLPVLAFAQATDIAPAPTARERIRSDREKYDRDLKLDTKRPWDGQDFGTGTVPKSKLSTTPIEPEIIAPTPR